ncbi:hypothetical protein AMR41_07465 [Hapalosiphon sp. MRB220]|nr:hypothetical protein AMR41_07465 [Hapalosiphon sp. MRB220]
MCCRLAQRTAKNSVVRDRKAITHPTDSLQIFWTIFSSKTNNKLGDSYATTSSTRGITTTICGLSGLEKIAT